MIDFLGRDLTAVELHCANELVMACETAKDSTHHPED